MIVKRLGVLTAVLGLMLAVAACGGSPSGGSGGSASGNGGSNGDTGKTYELLFGNTTTADTQEFLGKEFTRLVEEKSNGRIKGNFQSGSVLGDSEAIMRGLQSNSIQGTLNPTSRLTPFIEEAGVFEMPWLYPGDTISEVIDNTTKIMQGSAADKLKELAAEKGFRIVSLFGLGPNMIFSSSPITRAEDFNGKTIRVVPGKEHAGTLADWGARTVVTPFSEVYTSLQQGVFDGQQNPPDVSLHMNFQEVAPHVAATMHSAYVQYVAVSKQWYDGLPADLQQVVDQAGEELETIGTEAYKKSQQDALDQLRGIPAVTVTDFAREELDKMKELNEQGIWKTARQDPKSGPILELLLKDVQELVK